VHFQHLLAVVFRLRATLGPPHQLVKLPVSGLLHADFIGQVSELSRQFLLSLHRVLHLLLVCRVFVQGFKVLLLMPQVVTLSLDSGDLVLDGDQVPAILLI
jgi:hypothetical protein